MVVLVLGVVATAAGVSADTLTSWCPEPDSTTLHVTFDNIYCGNYRTGEPYDYVTALPNGNGETLTDTGITVVLTVKDRFGQPLVGVPASEMVLYNTSLAVCGVVASADAPTDINGQTTFTGALRAGGCAQGLEVYVEGCFMGTVPINVNSPDTGAASPGFVDSSDVAAFAARLGNPALWDICFDYNESGPPVIDSSDVAFFASSFGSACQ